MKTLKTVNRRNSIYFSLYSFLLSMAGVFLLMTSCEDDWRGVDGMPGKAFILVAWEVVQPDYLNTGSPDIPAYFQWGRYYPANPGVYFLYYEGYIPNAHCYSMYAWEIEYSIWINQGESGGWHYNNGINGHDNYFTLVCGPNGPYVDEYYKSGTINNEVRIEQTSENEFRVNLQGKDFPFEAIYRKVNPRKLKNRN